MMTIIDQLNELNATLEKEKDLLKARSQTVRAGLFVHLGVLSGWTTLYVTRCVCDGMETAMTDNCGARLALAIGKVCALHNFSANQQP